MATLSQHKVLTATNDPPYWPPFLTAVTDIIIHGYGTGEEVF